MSSYFNSVDPTDADDEVISNLANAFAKIVSNHSSLKAQKININADLLITFEDLEDLTGNLKRMLKKEKDVNPELKFTKNVRLLKTRINQLSISLSRVLKISSLVILTQSDLIMEEFKKL